MELTLNVADLKDSLSQVTMQYGTAESKVRQLTEQINFTQAENSELEIQLKSTQVMA